MAVFGQHALDRRHRDRAAGFVGFEFDQVGGRVEAVEADLRLDAVAVGREGAGFDQDRRPFARGPVEADHQQVQVGGERIHRHHFRRQGADQHGQAFAHFVVVGHPRMFAAEMRLHAQRGPVVELLQQGGAHRARLQAERVAAEVGLVFAVVLRDVETVAEIAERIGGVERQGLFQGRAHSNLERGRPSHSSAVPL